ncbi:hypothetical protein QQS21_003811 [Conoideocrella luteorostrata]|uniref:Uncharacterized protein n=1 Tax=Conoideocrella luteorostrata TaxID=1105319 RepID=A0AAJ0CTH5_9HYPO|nr:hypothetical protein QQS21_003811 [Conoideocrella luteorostrata]
MRNKGRFPGAIQNKLLVPQTDSSKSVFGLPLDEYKDLTTSVTHLIHSVWPMSAKEDLSGFESQFQVMRNLIDFGYHVVSCRSSSFKFSFQMNIFYCRCGPLRSRKQQEENHGSRRENV